MIDTTIEQTVSTIEQTVSIIETAAPTVAGNLTAHEEAIAEERAAAAALLARVVDLARPGRRAVSSRPLICEDWEERDEEGYRLDDAEPRTERADWAGLYLGEGRPGPERVDRWRNGQEQTRGTWGGTDLFLLPDGTFRTLTYSGTWSRWQGASSPWIAEEEEPEIEEIVAAKWAPSLSQIVKTLAAALTKEAEGGRVKATKAARDRAERLRALAALL